MIEEANRRSLKLGVTQHYIYSRGVLKTRKLIEERAIGDPLHFEISYFFDTAHAPVDWTSKPSEGGPLWELGIHPSYVLASFLGEPNEVNATGTYSFHSKHSSVHINVEKGPITAAIRMSPTPMEPFSLAVAGTEGYLYLDLMTDAVVRFSRLQRVRWLGRHPWVQGSVKLSLNQFRRSIATATGAVGRGVRYAIMGTKEFSQYRLFKSFIEYVKEGREFYSTAETGLYALLIVEATAKALGVSLPQATDLKTPKKE